MKKFEKVCIFLTVYFPLLILNIWKGSGRSVRGFTYAPGLLASPAIFSDTVGCPLFLSCFSGIYLDLIVRLFCLFWGGVT